MPRLFTYVDLKKLDGYYARIAGACLEGLPSRFSGPLSESKSDNFTPRLLKDPISLTIARVTHVIYLKRAPKRARLLSEQLKVISYLKELLDNPNPDQKAIQGRPWLCGDMRELFLYLRAERFSDPTDKSYDSLAQSFDFFRSNISPAGCRLYLTYISQVARACVTKAIEDFGEHASWLFPEREEEINRALGVQRSKPLANAVAAASKVRFFTCSGKENSPLQQTGPNKLKKRVRFEENQSPSEQQENN